MGYNVAVLFLCRILYGHILPYFRYNLSALFGVRIGCLKETLLVYLADIGYIKSMECSLKIML